MSVWNKVLLILLVITGIVYVWLNSQRFLLNKNWEEKLVKLEKQYEDLLTEVDKLKVEIHGNPQNKEMDWEKLGFQAQSDRIRILFGGYWQYRNTENKEAIKRCGSVAAGKVWVNCEPKQMVNNKGVVTTSFLLGPNYDWHGVHENGLVYVFDSGSKFQVNNKSDVSPEKEITDQTTPGTGSIYLGAFRVVNIKNFEVSLTSVTTLNEAEIARIDQSVKAKQSWIICVDRLPSDSPDDMITFSKMNPKFVATLSEQDKEYFAKTSYTPTELMELPPAEMNKADELKRVPVDYTFLLEKAFIKRDAINTIIARKEGALNNINIVLVDQLVAMGTEISAEVKPFVNQAIYDQKKKDNKLETWSGQQTRLTSELATMTQQRDFVKSKLDKAKETVLELRNQIAVLVKENLSLAAKAARAQIQAAERIQKASVQTASSSTKVRNDKI